MVSTDAETTVRLRQTLFERDNILGIRCLELTKPFLIDVRDVARADSLQKPYQPVALLMPIFDAHDSLSTKAALLA